MRKLTRLWKAIFLPNIFGIDDAIIAGVASAAVGAAASTYSANQANNIAQGNNATSNLFNMVGQLQNQGFNSAEAQTARAFNSYEASMARDFNANQAAQNREFQAYQSASSYQRAVHDMKQAGLNPMLAYSQGGASTPGGSAANINPAQAGMASTGGTNYGTAQTFQAQMPLNMASTALDALKNGAIIKNIEADTALKESEVPVKKATEISINETVKNIRQTLRLLEEQTRTEGYRGNREQYESYVSMQREELTEIQTRLERQRISQSEAAEQLDRLETKLKATYMQERKNQQAIDETTWGKKGRPILTDIGKVTGTAEGINSILRSRGR